MPRLVKPKPEEQCATCVPLVPLKMAARFLNDPQAVPDDWTWEHWVAVETGHKLRRGMFVAHVPGHSMEPDMSVNTSHRPCETLGATVGQLGCQACHLSFGSFKSGCDMMSG
jgi:hypothetical protein